MNRLTCVIAASGSNASHVKVLLSASVDAGHPLEEALIGTFSAGKSRRKSHPPR